MGIKGQVLSSIALIYGEIGPGERVALSKLAVKQVEGTGRPLRIAIDISIWSFQTQAGKGNPHNLRIYGIEYKIRSVDANATASGGKNPALRTLYYRLLRLLSFSIQPLFVFDGPNKPPVKRNARTGQHSPSSLDYISKQLLKLFGFPFHVAPGEAEAECALLQQHGIVDAVLSEDVDTLMFGCGLSMRNWSGELNKTPSHVNLYDAEKIKQGKSGLDREGMVLVALLSGGDYVTEGIPGCGIKIACEAARAGFGKELCALSRKDAVGRGLWRKKLAHEFHTNENKYFKAVHKAIKLPASFPDKTILGYYTHPVVSSTNNVEKLRNELRWNQEIDVAGLRSFAAEAFDWTCISGARKFVRCMAPALLVHKLRSFSEEGAATSEGQDPKLITALCGRREHMSSDGEPELRVVYVPADIVGLDLEAEDPDPQDDQVNDTSDDDLSTLGHDGDHQNEPGSPTRRPAPSTYDPMRPQKDWILETFVKLGAPLMVEDWEESRRNPKKYVVAKGKVKKAAAKTKPAKKVTATGGMKHGALDSYGKFGKPGLQIDPKPVSNRLLKSRVVDASSDNELPPLFLAPSIPNAISSPTRLVSQMSIHVSSMAELACSLTSSHKATQSLTERDPSVIDLSSPSQRRADRIINSRSLCQPSRRPSQAPLQSPTKARKPKKVVHKPISSLDDLSTPSLETLARNPWTLSQRPPDTLNAKLPRGARYSALGIYGPTDTSSEVDATSDVESNDNGLQSPPSSPTAPVQPWKHTRSQSSSSCCSARSAPRSRDRSLTPSKVGREPDEPAASLPTPPSRRKTIPHPCKKCTPRKSSGEDVFRRLDFGKAQSQGSESCGSRQASSPGLPDLETLLSATLSISTTKHETARSPSIVEIFSSPPSTNEPNRHPIKSIEDAVLKPEDDKERRRERPKRRIVLRQSQEGAWRVEEDVGTGRRSGKGGWRQSQIEVLDMTEEF
ncbi:MAG: hypothetical protein M1835_003839 [Candelina submexicana]|nr:MAG: hypothetical protein M1835_003839 [Candelina submexicana]